MQSIKHKYEKKDIIKWARTKWYNKNEHWREMTYCVLWGDAFVYHKEVCSREYPHFMSHFSIWRKFFSSSLLFNELNQVHAKFIQFVLLLLHIVYCVYVFSLFFSCAFLFVQFPQCFIVVQHSHRFLLLLCIYYCWKWYS